MYTEPSSPTFPLESTEPLWFWHVPTDSLILSNGAVTALGLPNRDQIRTMSDFLTHLPPEMLPKLNELREGVLNGNEGSLLKISYLFERLFVEERLMVLERSTDRRAVSVVGNYSVSEELSGLPEKTAEVSTVGLWHSSFFDRTVRFDRHGAALIRHAAGLKGTFVPVTLTHDEFYAHLHPDDAEQVRHDYEMLATTPALGDTMEHNVRIPRPDGGYTLMRMCGSVFERDVEKKIAYYGGTLTDLSVALDTECRHDLAQQDGRRMLYAVSNSTSDGLWDWDATTNHVYFSPRYLSMLGYSAEEFPGHLDIWAKRIHPEDHDKIIYPQKAIVESPRYGDTFECTYRLLRKDGTWAWILGRGYVTNRDESGRAIRLVGMHTDITGVQNEREKLEEMVKNDPLTGLRSRAYCNLEMERIENNRIRPVSVIMGDVTGLKMVNDCLGHSVGDKLLANTAMLLREPMRATDCVARTGGDEFAILLPGCAEEICQRLLERLRACVEAYNASEPEVPVYIAFGMAFTDKPEVSIGTAVRIADAAMMENKNRHRRASLTALKTWIEAHTGKPIDFTDSRIEC